MDIIAYLLGAANVVAFLWFLYEITRLEGWPGRKWHHAYLAVPLWIVAWYVITNPWWAFLLFAIAGLLIYDDAAQHRVHNRLKRQGVPMSEWPVSWLHRHYERAYRELTD
jgi:hypothetical protein